MKNSNYYTANNISILDVLEKLNEPTKKVGKKYRWTLHDSIDITDNKWYQHSQKRGGLTIDFLTTFFGYTENKAVKFLYDNFLSDDVYIDGYNNDKDLEVPIKDFSNQDVMIYLKNLRFIDYDLIKYFVIKGDIFQDRVYKNVVFVGRDRSNKIKHLHIQATTPEYEDLKYNILGSDLKYPFKLIGPKEKLYVFESPIDMLSFMTLNKSDYTKYSYLALCGLSDKAIFQTLKDFPHINEVILALDNDIYGFNATFKIMKTLEKKNIKVSYQFSWLKDYNEDLKYKYDQIAKAGLSNKLFKSIFEFELKIIEKIMNHKDILFKDLLNSFMKLYAIYNNSNQNQINEALLNLASHSTFFLRQQYRHLQKSYAPKEIIKSLQNKPLEYVKYSSVDDKLSQLTAQFEILKDNFVKKDYHSIDEKKEVMNALSEIIKYSLFLYIKLNERNKKQ